MKIILIIFVVLALALAGGYYIGFDIGFEKAVKKTSPTIQKEADYKSSFTIITNGVIRDFSFPKYHNQSKDVFITSENPNIINVKKGGVTWSDFFDTLPSPMKLSKDCLVTGTGETFCTNDNSSLKFFLNGQRDDNFLSKEIKDGDKALITYGNETDEEIKRQF